jgi:hypothetical protein
MNAAGQHRRAAGNEFPGPAFRSRSQYDLQLVETYKAKYEVKSMKLKKVTALLLATSMVISSVNVAPIFADEYIEEASFGTTEEASAEVDLSDDFGVAKMLLMKRTLLLKSRRSSMKRLLMK